jgi:hypothetical protein
MSGGLWLWRRRHAVDVAGATGMIGIRVGFLGF